MNRFRTLCAFTVMFGLGRLRQSLSVVSTYICEYKIILFSFCKKTSETHLSSLKTYPLSVRCNTHTHTQTQSGGGGTADSASTGCLSREARAGREDAPREVVTDGDRNIKSVQRTVQHHAQDILN